MKIAAVILHYRNPSGVADVLRSLRRQTHQPDRVIIVDNASYPQELRLLQLFAAMSDARLLTLPTNQGYAAAMNHALREESVEGADVILLLTHDALLGSTVVETLAGRLSQQPTTALVGPLLGWRSDPDRVFSAGGQLGPRLETSHHQFPRRLSDWDRVGPQVVDWLDGAVLAVRRTALQQVGGLEERFFLYFEEVELALRLSGHGWRVEVVPAARAWQEPGNFSAYLRVRNRYLLLRLHGSRRQRIVYVWITGWRLLADRISGDRAPCFLSVARGLIDALRGRYGAPPSYCDN